MQIYANLCMFSPVLLPGDTLSSVEEQRVIRGDLGGFTPNLECARDAGPFTD